MIKIITVVTARASYSRFKGTLVALEKNKEVNSKVVCTCSAVLEKYGDVSKIIRADGLSCTDTVNTEIEGNTLDCMPLTVSNTIHSLTAIFINEKPDFVITIGDRYETISTAIAASYMNISLIHIQGGELTGNIDEKVRHAITKLSDYHIVSTSNSKRRLVRMGENPNAVFNTGCPSIDIIKEKEEVSLDELKSRLKCAQGSNVLDTDNGYVVMQLHSETENYDSSFERAQSLLNKLMQLNKQLVVFWPNPDAGTDAIAKAIRIFKDSNPDSNTIYLKNLESRYFLKLLDNATCLVGNSSVGIRECSFMGVPVFNLGDRQRGRDRAPNVVDVAWSKLSTLDVFAELQNVSRESYNLYGNGNSAIKISEIIASLKMNSVKVFYE
jgi:UDP-hydrolysing UDP-N-acetyl-D-glucosamine 2-epimerase